MRYSFSAAGDSGSALVRKLKIGASVVLGQAVALDTNKYGEIIPAVAATATNAVGVTLGAGTYSTTQGSGASSANVEVSSVWGPLSVFECRISGSATAGSALATTAPANILTNTAASSGGTTVSDATGLSTITMTPGYVCGLSGANKGQVRVGTTHTDSTSYVVTVPFDYAIAVGDKFIRVPYAFGTQLGDFCTVQTELNGIVEVGTAAGKVSCIDVLFDLHNESDPQAYAYITFTDHVFNQLS